MFAESQQTVSSYLTQPVIKELENTTSANIHTTAQPGLMYICLHVQKRKYTLVYFPLHAARQGKQNRSKYGSNMAVRWDAFWKAVAGQATTAHLVCFRTEKKGIVTFYLFIYLFLIKINWPC